MAKKDSGNLFEDIAEQLSDRMASAVKAVPEYPPFGAVRLTEKEQYAQFVGMGDDPAKWSALIERHGLDSTISYARRMTKLAEKYGNEQPTGRKTQRLSDDESQVSAGSSRRL